MEEILRFEENDKTLCLFMDDNYQLIYGKYEDDKISYQLEQKEKNLIYQVYLKLLPSNQIKDLGSISYGDKKINHFYDFFNHFHLFYEGDKVTSDCLKLNFIFNNQEDYFAKEEIKRTRNLKKIKRRVRIGKRILLVSLSSLWIFLTSYALIKGINLINFHIAEKNYEKMVLQYEDRKIQFIEIVEAISNNPNLTDSEKEFFLSSSNYFLDNLDYFDYYTVLDNLKRLNIEYIKKESSTPGLYGKFMANGPQRGKIIIYGSTCFEDTPKEHLSHEFLHAFSKFSEDDNCFYEIVNTTLNNEYFGANTDLIIYDNAYSTLRKYFYMIAEIVDPEVLRNYHANPDLNLLIQEMMKIIPDETMATSLFSNIDYLFKIDELGNSDRESYEKLLPSYLEVEKKVLNTLKTYYEMKYQDSIENNLNIFFFFNPQHAATKIASELEFDFNILIHADDFYKLKQFKKIFYKSGNDNLVISLPNKLEEIPEYYTLEEILAGKTEYLYRTKEEIDLPLMEDGRYAVPTFIPETYLDYEVPYQKENKWVK